MPGLPALTNAALQQERLDIEWGPSAIRDENSMTAAAGVVHPVPVLLLLDEQAIHDLKEIGRRHDHQVRHLRMGRFRCLTQFRSMKR